MTPPPARLHFFLGGADLEMEAIAGLLARHAPGRYTDKGLAWGAGISDYADDIRAALGRGETPVLVELADDLPSDAIDRARTIVVDHHGPRAGADRPSSLEQVFRLLGRPRHEWTREYQLIAANDIGHVAAMRALQPPATAEEMREIRARDRRAQGLTEAEERAAEAAVAERAVTGRLTAVTVPGNRASAVADRMEPLLGGPGFDALMVAMADEMAVFADGDTIRWLSERVPGSWSGGALPGRGFWGAHLPPGPERDRLIAGLRARLAD